MAIIRTTLGIGVLLLVFSMLTIGCTAKKALTKDAINNIKTVSLPEEIPVLAGPQYHGMSQSVGMAIGGLIGGIIATSASDVPLIIEKFMADNNISIEQKLRKSFSSEIRRRGIFEIAPASSSDADFNLIIKEFGFKRKNLGPKVRPYMIIKVQLVDKSGHIIWERFSTTGSGAKIELQDIDTWLDDRFMFHNAFSKMTRAAAARALDRLSKAAEEK